MHLHKLGADSGASSLPAGYQQLSVMHRCSLRHGPDCITDFSPLLQAQYVLKCFVLCCNNVCLQGIFVDDDNTVLSGPDCSIGILTRDGALVIPPDDTGLAGMAARNVADLVMQVRCSLVMITVVMGHFLGLHRILFRLKFKTVCRGGCVANVAAQLALAIQWNVIVAHSRMESQWRASVY
jgi:hypothetical protein